MAFVQQIVPTVSLSALCQQATSLLVQTIPCEYSGIWQVVSTHNALHLIASAVQPDVSIHIENGSLQQFLEHQLAQQLGEQWTYAIDHASSVTSTAIALSLPNSLPPHTACPNSASGIAIPIASQSQFLGWISLFATPLQPFTADEIQFIQAIAHLLATAIQQKRANALLHIKTQTLEQIILNLPLQDVLTNLCLQTEQVVPGVTCAAFLLKRLVNQLDSYQIGGNQTGGNQTGRFRLEAGPNVSPSLGYAIDRLLNLQHGNAMELFALGKAVVFLENIQLENIQFENIQFENIQTRDWAEFSELVQHGVRAWWSSPFFSKTGEVLGIMAFIHSVPCKPTADHHQLIQTVTNLAGLAVEHQLEQEALKHHALYDKLTGLPNRVLLIQHLQHRLQHQVPPLPDQRSCPGVHYVAPTARGQFAVLFLDVDHFKLINDSYGHSIGDQLLVEIIRRIQPCIRSNDIFARLGGDEFAILLDDIPDISHAKAIAHRIQTVLSAPVKLGEYEVFISISIGITHSSKGHHHPEELLQSADTAMYRAKAMGRACYAVFNQEMQTNALARLRMEMDLRRVVDSLVSDRSTQLQLYYQPIISLETGAIAGFEALLRWMHPERGIISPTEFIPMSEEKGLIIPIGQWVLQEACHQLRQWQRQLGTEHLFISVNVSSRQFLQSNFSTQIHQLLHSSQVLASCLRLEITESVLMETASLVTQQLEQLRDLGIRLSLDDFGTEYSSLSYLHQFPINTIKVDRSFIRDFGNGQEQQDQIVRTIIAMAHSLKMDVTAEGVETRNQLRQLRSLGCEFGQGYLFSPAVTADAARDMLRSNP